MRSFRILVLRRFAQAPLRSAMTALAIAAGVALAVSISILTTSIDRSLSQFGRGFSGTAELRITGATLRGGLPVTAVDVAREVEGVAEVTPMIRLVTQTQLRRGAPAGSVLVLGVDCSLEALIGPFGCDPATLAGTPGAIAVGPSLELGPEAVLRTDRGRVSLADAPRLDALGRLGDGRVVVLPLAFAQEQFTRAGQVDQAYVDVLPGHSIDAVRARLEAALGSHLPVVAANAPPAGTESVLGAALPIFTLLGIFALGIGAVLVANAAAMSVESRRRELAVLGAIGARRRSVLGWSVAEMAVLGLIGGLLGSLGGMVVARPIVSSLSSFTESFVGARLTTHVSASNIAVGLLLGTVLGAGAAVLPARRATRIDVAGELSGREAADQVRPARLGRRAVIWTAVLAVGAWGCWAAPRGGGLDAWQATVITPANLAMTLATLFLTAALVPMAVGRLARMTSGSTSATLRVSMAAARRDHRRTGVLAVAVAASVVTAFVTDGSSASARAGISQSFERAGPGVDVATIPTEGDLGPQVWPELIEALEGLPGVASVEAGVFVVAGRGADLLVVRGVSSNRLTETVVDGVADPDRLFAGEVLIGAGLARRQGLRAGDAVRLATPAGMVDLPVQGVWEDGSNAGGNITMSQEAVTAHFGPQPASYVMVRPEPGVSEVELAATIDEAALDPELRTRLSGVVAAEIADEVDGQLASFRVMQRALLAVLFVAVLSSLLLAAVQRRRELGLLAAVGADPPRLARVLVAEAAVVAVIAVAVSVVNGPVTMWSFNQALPFVIGFRNPLTLAWFTLASAGGTAILIVLLGAAWPARRAARVEVLDALRYE